MTEEVSQIPLGLCQCGCGKKTNISPINDPSRDYIKGQHYRFARGHSMRNFGTKPRWITEDRGFKTLCHIHTGFVNRDGYGTETRDGKSYLAHRLTWIDKHGYIPDKLCVLHKCDVPSCRNIDHLFLGTNKDNVDDKVAKRRHARGETNGRSKLTWNDVHEIRSSKDTYKNLCARYGVGSAAIASIRGYKSWKEEAI